MHKDKLDGNFLERLLTTNNEKTIIARITIVLLHISKEHVDHVTSGDL